MSLGLLAQSPGSLFGKGRKRPEAGLPAEPAQHPALSPWGSRPAAPRLPCALEGTPAHGAAVSPGLLTPLAVLLAGPPDFPSEGPEGPGTWQVCSGHGGGSEQEVLARAGLVSSTRPRPGRVPDPRTGSETERSACVPGEGRGCSYTCPSPVGGERDQLRATRLAEVTSQLLRWATRSGEEGALLR